MQIYNRWVKLSGILLITDNVSFGTWDWELLANEWNTDGVYTWEIRFGVSKTDEIK